LVLLLLLFGVVADVFVVVVFVDVVVVVVGVVVVVYIYILYYRSHPLHRINILSIKRFSTQCP